MNINKELLITLQTQTRKPINQQNLWFKKIHKFYIYNVNLRSFNDVTNSNGDKCCQQNKTDNLNKT